MFHLDISGNDFNDEHPSNIDLIFIQEEKLHFDIKGKDFNDEHPLNK